MSGKRDWTPWMKKRRAPVLCALGAVLLCCLQGGACLSGAHVRGAEAGRQRESPLQRPADLRQHQLA
ncbi:hypothetical protein F7725_029085 [Dissostichus mawsoni]|uniref:Uncharacterized protein n=1 Tax=Dissostichus mawsoni TaxID=36200 RepID=A0A7J5XIV8_DISMA|nr:hypothetical protein F7725_029085 [Dissostichus mawsoni]